MREELKPLLLPVAGKPRHIFFAGKGGVGKTSLACITAVATAAEGIRTLLLTTDPAAHIGEVLDTPISDRVLPVAGVENLFAAKIDQKKATEEYKEEVLRDARQKFDECTVKAMAEELDSPCTEEMAAFQKIVDYTTSSEYDVVVFDTAPTGHTLRLLALPLDWSRQIQWKAGADATLNEADKKQQDRFQNVMAILRDPQSTTFCFVVYPEKTPIVESQRASHELAGLDIRTQLVVANLVIPEEQAITPFFQNRRKMQLKYLDEIKERFPDAGLLTVPMHSREIKGLAKLQEMAAAIL
jgi:arsenite-transporting ATPase